MLYYQWMKKLDEMDTPRIKEARYKQYWYMFELGGGFITWKPRIWIVNVIYAILMNINLFYYVPCFIVSVFKVKQLAEIGQYINYVALFLVGQATILTGVFNQDSVLGMFQISLDGFYDYQGGVTMTAEIETLIGYFQLFKKMLKIVIPSFFGLIACTILMADYIDLFLNYHNSTNATIINGIYQNLPLKMWYYHSIDTEFDRFLTICSQVVSTGLLAMAITSADLLLIFFGQELIVQQKILQTACATMDERADALYKSQFGKEPSKNPIQRSKDEQLTNCYKYCLKQMVEHHLVILDFAEKFKGILNWPCGVVILDGAIAMATSALGLMQGGGQPSLLIASSFILISEMASMFVLNEIGQIVADMSDDILNALYNFKWMDCSQSLKKELLIMKMSASIPIVMMAGSLTPLNRVTFSTLINSAYSYWNVMRAIEMEN